jgi:uncharacterized protein YkwD
LEQKVIEELNLARKQPRKYATLLEQRRTYYVGKLLKRPGSTIIRTEEGVRALDEAIRYLKSMKPQAALTASEGLSRAAKDHVLDQGPDASYGHTGDDGSHPFERMQRYGRIIGQAGENISYGPDEARDIIIGLIIDDGVPDRGHRKSLFNNNFKRIGVSFGYHAKFHFMCVITLASHFDTDINKFRR